MPGCSRTGTWILLIGDDGQAASSVAPSLVDRPRGQASRCEYDAIFPAAVSTTIAVGSETLALVPAESATVSAASPTASAGYVQASTVFSPDLAIAVPATDADGDGRNDFAGTTFRVTFHPVMGSHVYCLGSPSETWRVAADGTVTRRGAAARLAGDFLGADNLCAYSVAFPASVSCCGFGQGPASERCRACDRLRCGADGFG